GGVKVSLGSSDECNNSLRQALLSTLQVGDVARFKTLLPDTLRHPSPASKSDLDHVFPSPVQGTLLHVAAKKNLPDVAKRLIEHGADPNIRDLSGMKYTPLHYAVEDGNHEVIKILLDGGANPNARESGFGRTSLHLLLKKWKSNEDNFKSCLDILLDHNKINVDSQDDNRATPLDLSCKKECEYMARKLILKGADLQYIGRNNVTEAEMVKTTFPDLLEAIVKSNDLTAVKKPRLFGDELLDKGLKNHDFRRFKEILNDLDNSEEDKSSILEEDYGKTLLHYACNNGLTDFVQELINHGADPMKADKTNLNCPILYATRKGYFKIIEILTTAMESEDKIEDGLKQVDQRGETVLHKVAKREYRIKEDEDDRDYKKCLEVLMNYKEDINMDATDEFGNTALHYAVLWDDQSFVRHLLLNGAHWGIKNESGIMPITNIKATVLEEILDECIKLNNTTDLEFREFEIVLNYCMLVPAFNALKPETERLKYLSGSDKHKHLLCHPIINTFLHLKWQRIKPYYYINMIAYTFYLFLLTTYILIFHRIIEDSSSSPIGNNSTSNIDGNITASSDDSIIMSFSMKISLQILISIFTLYIALREIVQFIVSWRLYIARIENWIECSIVILTVFLFLPLDNLIHQSLAAWLILFAWTEFVLLLGCHPKLAVYIAMFKKVSFNFLKFILMFSFMLLAFSLSFYLVYQVNEQFTTYHQSLLRTLAMTTGELEYTDLPLSAFPVSSHLLFIVFVFLIVLVLMNLLNGLAVSDIAVIQKEAEIVSYKSRVELITYLESVFLVGACPLFDLMPASLRCCSTGDDNILIRLLNWLGPKTLMLRDCLKNQSIKMFPNRGKGRCWEICDCHSSSLERSHIDSAMSVVITEEHRVADSLTELKDHMANMDKAIERLTEMVQNHVLCPSPVPKTNSSRSIGNNITVVE
ncbi:unnamed protein product, partial [Meganyctiphanes norvegica]